MDYILQYILPSILGDFIQGLDKHHMKTSFFSGKVTLQNISLNPNLLKPLGVPVKISFSEIGKLEVKIPWTKRMKEPTELYLEDLFVLLEPTPTMEDYDIVKERIKFIDKLIQECRNKLRAIHKDTAQEGGSLSYYKILILDNLQVKGNILLIYFVAYHQEYPCQI
jgi:Vacuolar protein sorting-associated protein